MLRKLPLVLVLVPLILVAACSDGGAGATSQATATPAVAPTQEKASGTIEGTIRVDFTGAPEERDRIEVGFSVEAGSTAWDAVKMALGEDNLTFMDFGGDLGIFISGFNGVNAEGDHFWEFRVNGESGLVGVAKYEVQQGDVIEFVYSSF